MKQRIFRWLDRKFVELYGEARSGVSMEATTAERFETFQRELLGCGLTWANTVRPRLWATDKEARTWGTAARAKILTGSGKASSSSYVAPDRFDSNARWRSIFWPCVRAILLSKENPSSSNRREITFAISATDWSKVVTLTVFLHRSQTRDRLKEILADQQMLAVPEIEFGFVDGYGGEKNLVEVEATAVTGAA